MMPERWVSWYPESVPRAYTQRVPTYRLLASIEGELVGNLAVFDLSVTVPTFGLGDLVVHPDVRERGIARELLTVAVSDLRERTTAVIMTDTGFEYLRRILQELGFRQPEPNEMFFVEAGERRVFPNWLWWLPPGASGPLEIAGNC